MKKFIYVSFLTIAGAGILQCVALACSCASPAALPIEFSQSTAVFSGEAIKILHISDLVVEVTFAKQQNFKGPSDENIAVRTMTQETACGVDFQMGQQYLVYAYSDPNVAKDIYFTNACTRTKLLSLAQEDLKALDLFNRAK